MRVLLCEVSEGCLRYEARAVASEVPKQAKTKDPGTPLRRNDRATERDRGPPLKYIVF